ncbi:hypothetical protein K435DRAFT_375595 [Dendrothele bispora CBS 962.96]|uniref:Uncharacterized protein n=1 Tax=Dendrothele bispora (strain CBS 962.96) TaxID=1314807 RepID=A0A4S8MGS5_DENBC|nr:hypothetical protein K435DRAFT_375595 [Dendrothele bispora CBS 962.96]
MAFRSRSCFESPRIFRINAFSIKFKAPFPLQVQSELYFVYVLDMCCLLGYTDVVGFFRLVFSSRRTLYSCIHT